MWLSIVSMGKLKELMMCKRGDNMAIPLVPKEDMELELTQDFKKDNTEIYIQPEKDHFSAVINNLTNILIDICVSENDISSGINLYLPQELMEDISNFLTIEIEKDGDINRLILDDNIVVSNFVQIIEGSDILKIEEVDVSIGPKIKGCKEISITGNIRSVVITNISDHSTRPHLTVLLPIELIKFICDNLGIESPKAKRAKNRRALLDKNIRLADASSLDELRAENQRVRKVRYYFRNRPRIDMLPEEGLVNYEIWPMVRTTPYGREAFGWVDYDGYLFSEAIRRCDLFEDELPKLVKQIVEFARDESIDEAMRLIRPDESMAVWEWLKSHRRIKGGKGQKDQIKDEIIRLMGIANQ